MKEDNTKAEEHAEVIKMIAMFIHQLDTKYLEEVSIRWNQQASWQESASILNPSYNHKQSELLYKQSLAIQQLLAYIKTLKEIDSLKLEIEKDKTNQDKINKLFW